MRDLQGIAETNGPNRVRYAIERDLVSNVSIDPLGLCQREHGRRVEARRRVNNTPFSATPAYLGMDGIHSAIDQKPGSPFMQFWLELNEQRGVEVRYGEARSLFNGGPTPEGAVTYVEKGDDLRAIPAPDRPNGEEAWYGEYREITGKGTKWHRVVNDAGNPILYTSPIYALGAAVLAKGNAIEKAFH